jgi:hypothetical protein
VDPPAGLFEFRDLSQRHKKCGPEIYLAKTLEWRLAPPPPMKRGPGAALGRMGKFGLVASFSERRVLARDRVENGRRSGRKGSAPRKTLVVLQRHAPAVHVIRSHDGSRLNDTPQETF